MPYIHSMIFICIMGVSFLYGRPLLYSLIRLVKHGSLVSILSITFIYMRIIVYIIAYHSFDFNTVAIFIFYIHEYFIVYIISQTVIMHIVISHFDNMRYHARMRITLR